ncbi:ATP-binding protein [Vibrio sp. NH-UV-68]|uniref:ATP-binding protein n=1 Tax=unclassified Vibrio TaxID=2614977 RepID=UPI0036F32BDA
MKDSGHSNDTMYSQNSAHMSSKALITRHRLMIYGALVLIILLTLGNALYLSKEIRTQEVSKLRHQALETMLALNKTISVSINHVGKMRNAIESAYQYPDLTPSQSALEFLSKNTLGSPKNAPWENLPDQLKNHIGQLYVRSNSRDYSFDQRALLTMVPEIVATHAQHNDFQWSYYYDAKQALSYLYPWLSYKDLLQATEASDMDQALDIIYQAGGTYPLDLIKPEANPQRDQVWTTPYMDAGGKGMMISLLAPVYVDGVFVGAVGTDITLKVLDTILTERPLDIARLVIVDEQGLVIGDSKGTLQNTTEAVKQQGVLTLVAQGEAHQVDHATLHSSAQGYWSSYQLPNTPWRLVLEITDAQLGSHIFTIIMPNLIMATAFTLLLLFVVLYQHWNFSQPALRLAQFVEELPSNKTLVLPDIPDRWSYWFERAANTEKDRRDYLEKTKQQTEDLEQRVEERTQELKQALDILKATQEELVRSEKLSGLGSLVAGIAHELNTPIGNAIVVASSLKDFNREFVESTKEGLRRSVLDNYIEQSGQSADSIERNLRRAAELISSFKQVAVDQSSYQRRTFELDEILHELRITMSPNLSRSNITLSEACQHKIKMDSYPGPLTQVLMNLLSNALVHAFTDHEQRQIEIKGSLEQQHAVITVTDNGLGIANEHLNKVFDPFFTTRLGQGGSGLGLNIVYNLVTGLLGGEIKVTSELGQGCCFTLTLPLVAPENENPDADESIIDIR